jgi:5-methylthioribose kinase
VYAQGLFESVQERQALTAHQSAFTKKLFGESLEFAGCKMIRRILGLAHVEDLESIVDPALRAKCERLALQFGRELILQGRGYSSAVDVVQAARERMS